MPRVTGKRRRGPRVSIDYRPTTINLTPELDEALDNEALAMGVTRSALVRIALESWIADGRTLVRSPRASATD